MMILNQRTFISDKAIDLDPDGEMGHAVPTRQFIDRTWLVHVYVVYTNTNGRISTRGKI